MITTSIARATCSNFVQRRLLSWSDGAIRRSFLSGFSRPRLSWLADEGCASSLRVVGSSSTTLDGWRQRSCQADGVSSSLSPTSMLQVRLSSSLPKRYQKRDDETNEEYDLRFRELLMQDAKKQYETILAESTSSSSDPNDAAQQQQQQEKLRVAMEQLRQTYEDLRYWDQAIDIQEKLLDHHISVWSATINNHDDDTENRRTVAESYVKMGNLYGETQKHHVEARRYYKQALDLYVQLHTPPTQEPEKQQQEQPQPPTEKPPTEPQPPLSSSSTLSTSSTSSAKPLMHADIGQVLYHVAMSYSSQDEFIKAEGLFKQAKSHFEYHGLPDEVDETPEGHQVHPGIFQVYEGQASIYRMMEKHELALSVYQEAHSVAKELQLEATSEYWDDLEMSMADCHLAMDRTQRALYSYTKLLDKAVKQQQMKKATGSSGGGDGVGNGDESDEIDFEYVNAMSLESVMRHNIGHIHAKEGRYSEALGEFIKAYDLIRKVSRSDTNPELIKTLHGLGAVNATLGNYPEARNYFREALELARLHADPALGDDDPKVAYSLRNLDKLQHDRRPPQAF